jgi:hypothetical protein
MQCVLNVHSADLSNSGMVIPGKHGNKNGDS